MIEHLSLLSYGFDKIEKKKRCILENTLKIYRFSRGNYNSEILSPKKAKIENLPISILPNIIIFDGANSFLKSRDDWLESHAIILLDRTENHFQEAIDTLNQDYINRSNDFLLKQFSLPFGVEIVAYKTHVQERY